eukprot:scaffold2858_cov659-Pavlova_lutheri.AAC.9
MFRSYPDPDPRDISTSFEFLGWFPAFRTNPRRRRVRVRTDRSIPSPFSTTHPRDPDRVRPPSSPFYEGGTVPWKRPSNPGGAIPYVERGRFRSEEIEAKHPKGTWTGPMTPKEGQKTPMEEEGNA